MPFPEIKRVIYEKNPLAEVVGQFYFSPLLRIERDGGAGFQEQVRDLYPFYFDEPQAAVQHESKPLLHNFVSSDTHWKLSLARDRVSLSTTVYERWEEFLGRLEMGSDALEQSYGSPNCLGVQLYYRDVVNRTVLQCEHVPWSALIAQTLHGELADPEVGPRIEELHRSWSMPLVEHPGTLKFSHGFQYTADGHQVFVIETMLSHEFQGGLQDGYRFLKTFHDLGARVFRWAITDELHELLEPCEVDEVES
jgi:uncharacterized protein (TIGR04255 family)